MDIVCKSCGNINDYREIKGGQNILSAYCNGCNEFIQILPDNRPIIIMPFGKYKGRKISSLTEKEELQYVNYILENFDLDNSLRNSLIEIL